MVDDLPNHWADVGRHHARVRCTSCDGTGKVEGFLCGLCLGEREGDIGCGGTVEEDLNHPGFTYCKQCRHTIAAEEVTR